MLKEEVLSLLLNAREPVSGEGICKTFGVTRAAVRNAASPTSVSFPNGFAANTRSTYDVSSASPAPNSGRSNTSARFASAL